MIPTIVEIGELSRGGYNRLQTPLQTCDHDQHWYYPPYHSKYNSIKRFFAILGKYWAGCILDSVKNTLKIVQHVKYKGHQVSSKLLDKIY